MSCDHSSEISSRQIQTFILKLKDEKNRFETFQKMLKVRNRN
jgi:hypothetical protein